MATLSNFNSFHSMIAEPFAAQKCIQSFKGQKGCVLFVPSSYVNVYSRRGCGQQANKKDEGANDVIMEEINLYDASKLLNLISYYALVLLSFTGLSTVIGLTRTISIVEFADEDHPQAPITVWPLTECTSRDLSDRRALLKSDIEPRIEVKDEIFQYIDMHLSRARHSDYAVISSDNGTKNELATTIKLVRKFEYYFRLVGLSVIMLHFTSNTGRDSENILHLVEVYHFQNPLIRTVMGQVLAWMGSLMRKALKQKKLSRKLHVD